MNYIHKKISILVILIAIIMGNLSDSFSQNNNLRTVRDSLTNYFTSISNEKSDDEKLKLNKNITRIFESYLFI